jgi:hypothetical protein
MKLVFPFYSLLDSGKPPLYSKIVRHLQSEYDVEIIAVTFGKTSCRFLKNECSDIRFHSLYDLNEFIANNLRSPGFSMSEKDLISLETQYGIPNLWLYIIAGDPLLTKINKEKALRIIIAEIKFWENLFDTEKPDAFIDEGIGGCILPVCKVAENYGVSILNLMTSRVPNRFVIHDNPFGHCGTMERIFNDLKQRRLTQTEETEANLFLKQFKSRRLKPPYMEYVTRPPPITFRAPVILFKYFTGYYGDKNTKYFSISRPPLNVVKELLLRICHYKLVTLLKNIWEKPKEEKYILFPLQFQPENSTKVLAPFYLDQLALIENIAKALPINLTLYVKEHQASISMRPLSYYKRIKNIPNTHLISPFADNYELIKGSVAVATITSTMGWEAILYQKPVIVFGNVFYDIFDLVYKVRDITKLPYVLNEAVSSFRQDDELLKKFILAFLKGTYQGEMLYEALSDENIKNLCKGIALELDLVSNEGRN